jgi:hypothetical protein
MLTNILQITFIFLFAALSDYAVGQDESDNASELEQKEPTQVKKSKKGKGTRYFEVDALTYSLKDESNSVDFSNGSSETEKSSDSRFQNAYDSFLRLAFLGPSRTLRLGFKGRGTNETHLMYGFRTGDNEFGFILDYLWYDRKEMDKPSNDYSGQNLDIGGYFIRPIRSFENQFAIGAVVESSEKREDGFAAESQSGAGFFVSYHLNYVWDANLWPKSQLKFFSKTGFYYRYLSGEQKLNKGETTSKERVLEFSPLGVRAYF